MTMRGITDIAFFNHSKISVNAIWNYGEHKELLLHRIHSYPAKFPPFLVPKLIKQFEEEGKLINLVADPFCGCGTSALESTRLGKDFWGCDINPVATLIARTKSRSYRSSYLKTLYEEIRSGAKRSSGKAPRCFRENQRLNYWFDDQTIDALFRLLRFIKKVAPPGQYRNFFLVGFSNILKPCSFWLTKSIKPQVDPKKEPAIPLDVFDRQIKMMIKANEEAEESVDFRSKVRIITQNILAHRVEHGFADVVITSPPYVTSYEYADLHQLSALWLGYTDDYRNLRNGTIGSQHHGNETENIYEQVNQVAKYTYSKLNKIDRSKARSVLRYFYDLDLTVKKIGQITKSGGGVAFIIGNTSYKNILIDNAKFLAKSLLDHGFTNIKVAKRKISYKNLTPFRNEFGRFTTVSRGRKVYSHEYILTCENRLSRTNNLTVDQPISSSHTSYTPYKSWPPSPPRA